MHHSPMHIGADLLHESDLMHNSKKTILHMDSDHKLCSKSLEENDGAMGPFRTFSQSPLFYSCIFLV